MGRFGNVQGISGDFQKRVTPEDRIPYGRFDPYAVNEGGSFTPGTDLSNMAMAGASGSTGLIGPIAGAISAQRALNKRKRQGVLDTRPDELRSQMGKYALSSSSTRVPNYNRAIANIDATQAQAAGDAALAATNPAQLQAMIRKNAMVAGGQKMGLDQAGVEMQRRNEAINNELLRLSGQYKDKDQASYNTDIASLRNAVWANINTAANQGQRSMDKLMSVATMGA